MSVAEAPFEIFGEKSSFALEIRSLPTAVSGAEPEDWEGSWGEWRLWVANLNLCELRFDTRNGAVEVQEIQWFLAPLFIWIAENWMPLLHEKRLPPGGRFGDSRPRSSRTAYLAMLESAGDDFDRFSPWQRWASRHSLRTASAGAILPDVFLRRMEDDLEFSWGDRVQPGAYEATFIVEDGVARVSVDAVATSLFSAVEWFLERQALNSATWVDELRACWEEICHGTAGITALSWYLDSSREPKALTRTFMEALKKLNRQLSLCDDPWWGTLSPEVAMFGDLSPNISVDAAGVLLAEYFKARTQAGDSDNLAEIVSDIPAWSTSSPWPGGYARALDVLAAVDPAPKAPLTQIEHMLQALGITVRDLRLGRQGPRGIALAGQGLQATILINMDHVQNSFTGRRFTMAHEFCHILFDRSSARPLTHSSTPWASPSVEQRANAFAVMLLMPPKRARLPIADEGELKDKVNRLATKMKVSRSALRQHLANINQIQPDELDTLLGAHAHAL